MNGFYTVSWGGISVGKLVMIASEDEKQFSLDAYVKTSGIVYAITRHESKTSTRGKVDRKAQRYIPTHYETVFKMRGKTRHIILDYDSKGRLKKEFNDPPENRSARPEVPMNLKRTVVDALNPFFTQRPAIYKALKGHEKDFTLRMFDGRRLTDLHYHVVGRQWINQNDTQKPVIIFKLSSMPIAGYKKSELEDLKKETNPDISFYLSDDGLLLPIKLVIEASGGTFYANLTQQCRSVEACLKML